MLTLTAPGIEPHLAWYRNDGSMCSCTPDGGVELSKWNASHSARWNLFRTRLSQRYGFEYFRGIEVQKRGALHDHVLLYLEPGVRRPTLKEMRQLAIECGFGCNVTWDRVKEKRGAAYYASKTVSGYVSKSADSRDQVPWEGEAVDLMTGEVVTGPVHARYRTWSASHHWGLTMKALRARRREVATINAGIRQAADQAIAQWLATTQPETPTPCGLSPPVGPAGHPFGPAR